ncbi:MAG: manganese catalase family protein [Clostridia bacterium]|nr:manganese catalase family protein [Clostridia bacterium]
MNLENINYENFEIKTPYPEVSVIKKEANIRKMLIDAYAGSKGEFTASTQYIYQSFIMNPIDKIFYKILERIAIKEMHHLEILSGILIQLGVNPKFCTYIDNNINICNAWSTNNIRYITDPIEFIKYNIFLEEDTIKMYNDIINTTEDTSIKDILMRIVEDEESHLAMFNAMLDALTQK